IYIHADYAKDFENLDLMEEFDYCFIGIVDSYIQTSQYNGYGTEIPYSYFYVNVTKNLKGRTDKKIIIKFYGGYDETDDSFILCDEMEYPEIGTEYKFYCNKTLYSFAEDNRTIDSSFVISMKYNMQKVNQLKEEALNDSTNLKGIDMLSVPGPSLEIIKDEGAGNADNFSFDKAYEIKLNDSMSVVIPNNTARYYKFTAPSLEYFAIFSKPCQSRYYNPNVEIYDSNFNLIGENDNVNPEDHGRFFTSGDNFFYQFYAEKNTTIYFKVNIASELKGCFYLNLKRDNWYKSCMDDLLLNYAGVGSDKKVDYTINSKYIDEINYGIAEWSKLETIKFSPDTWDTINNVTISDYYDKETATIAYTLYLGPFSEVMKYNDFHFETMSREERIMTVLHEFGHVLGLDEFTGLETTINVMYQGKRAQTRLGPADIAAYRARWDLIYDEKY
ncbi:MAG: hypothetical protein K2J85_06585, partial [Anaeroplasmataceae bacterium]|nr:hypothetical protein [Anaeroplasmataceae bacterium]